MTLEIELENWRQMLWPTEGVDWPGYDVMDVPLVPDDAAVRPRRVAASDLAPWEARQIVDALAAGAEASRDLMTLAALLSRLDAVYAGAKDIAEYVLGAPVEWWDLKVDGLPRRYVLCLFGIDCGRIYVGESERVVGWISQDSLVCDEPELASALAPLQAWIRRAAPTSRLARVAMQVR